MVNNERLAEIFVTLCQIDSPSKKEGRIAEFIKTVFSREFPGARIREDNSADKTGSESNNIVVQFPGTLALEPLFLNCHLDTVEPGCGVSVKRQGSIFTSAGDTILGGDDKAGIAILIEAMRLLQEQHLEHRPVELLFTTCEEIGLLGAKHLDYSILEAVYGYCLDSSGIDRLVIGAPAANHVYVEIFGRAAHAGLCPEKGISAIQIAAHAISLLQLGRLDHESTANLGVISGGTASNIIPEHVRIKGEVRSHDAQKLSDYTSSIEQTFKESVLHFVRQEKEPLDDRPTCTFRAPAQYPLMRLQHDDFIAKHAVQCAGKLGRNIDLVIAGGGSDANIFNAHQRQTAILGIGMENVHSVHESICLNDMVRVTQLIAGILTS